MAVGYTEEPDYTQHFAIKKFGQRNLTLYYENYGPTRLIGEHYKVVTYLSLKEYNKKYKTLGEGTPGETQQTDVSTHRRPFS